MKVNTVEQYKIVKYIENNFNIGRLEVTLIDRNTVQIKDKNNDTMTFKYDGKEIRAV